MKTNVHYPTDANLLSDACRKIIEFATTLASGHKQLQWRQNKFLLAQHKKRYHKVRNLKHSTSTSKSQRAARQEDVELAYIKYLNYSLKIIKKAQTTLSLLEKRTTTDTGQLNSLQYWIKCAGHQAVLINRRVLNHEDIPHAEKVFSFFEPHTEWISKGKAGVPVEFGIRVCVLQDQFGFTLHHQVMVRQTDDKVTVPMAEEAKKRFPELTQVSYDKGFWSPDNLVKLEAFLDLAILPKKGKLSAEDKRRETHPEFIRARKKHSAVESDINALECHGLDKCPDEGLDGFKRYAAIAVLGTNLYRLGKILQEKDRTDLRKAA